MDQYSRWNFSNINFRRQCYKCGFLFGIGHLRRCYAKNAKCYRCGIIGHYARCCWTYIPQNSINVCNINHIPETRDYTVTGKRKHKSTKRKQRDLKRYRKYKEQKKLVNQLPFHFLKDTELLEILDKRKTKTGNSQFTKRICSHIKRENEYKIEVASLKTVLEQKNRTLKTISDTIRDISSELEEKTRLLEAANNNKQQYEKLLETVNKINETNEANETTISVQQDQILSLEKEIERVKSENQAIREENQEIGLSKDLLYIEYLKQINSGNRLRDRIEDLTRENTIQRFNNENRNQERHHPRTKRRSNYNARRGNHH